MASQRKRRYRRGYPVAILIGLGDNQAVLWNVFSQVVKPEKTLYLNGTRNDSKAMYNFHESILNAIRPMLNEGIRSIIVASPTRSMYAQNFIDHIHQHHLWLGQGPNKAVFSAVTGSAGTRAEVTTLIRKPTFHQLINKTTSEETKGLLDILDKYLRASNQGRSVLYSVREIEDLLLNPWKHGRPKPIYLLLTDKYLSTSTEKNRLHRLIQIAKNKNAKTRIVAAESRAGLRLTQLGGCVCLCTT
jgi:stalled ribosome rescue protein Dom34